MSKNTSLNLFDDNNDLISESDLYKSLKDKFNMKLFEMYSNTKKSLLEKKNEDLIENVYFEESDMVEASDDDQGDDIIDAVYNEELGGYTYISLDENLNEKRYVYRVTHRGRKIKRLRCGSGRMVKNVGGKQRCVPKTGKHKMTRRLATRKRNRTISQKGAGFARKREWRRKRAMKRRSSFGL